MNAKKIKVGNWYDTKSGGTFPPSAMVHVLWPIPRGTVTLRMRDVIRELSTREVDALKIRLNVAEARRGEVVSADIDAKVMARLKAPFGCEFIEGAFGDGRASRWRIHDANDDAVASCSGREEGYARLIVDALNEHFAKFALGSWKEGAK